MTTNNTLTLQDVFFIGFMISKEINRYCTYKEYPINSILSLSYSINNRAIFLTDGVLKRTYIDNSGHEIIYHITKAPVFTTYTLSGFFQNKISSSACISVTPIKGYEISSEDLAMLTNENPELYEFYFLIILRLYQAMQAKEISILENDSTTRYRNFANYFSEHLQSIPLKDIASYLNIQPGSLSRIRKKLNT